LLALNPHTAPLIPKNVRDGDFFVLAEQCSKVPAFMRDCAEGLKPHRLGDGAFTAFCFRTGGLVVSSRALGRSARSKGGSATRRPERALSKRFDGRPALGRQVVRCVSDDASAASSHRSDACSNAGSTATRAIFPSPTTANLTFDSAMEASASEFRNPERTLTQRICAIQRTADETREARATSSLLG
jgi:hypothetical protein